MTTAIERTPNVEILPSTDQTVNMESFWQFAGLVDALGHPYPDPVDKPLWDSQLVEHKIARLQRHLRRRKRYIVLPEWMCPLCSNTVRNRVYEYHAMRWSSVLMHQITVHHWRPSRMFIDFIIGTTVAINRDDSSIVLAGTHGRTTTAPTVTIGYNQWAILDALMLAGGKRKWHNPTDARKKMYSEIVGYLTLEPSGTTTAVSNIVLGRSDVVDAQDNTILFPTPLEGVSEHKYYFHTHPPTPTVGARVRDGILYEFPSPSDIQHFVIQQSYGKTKGSIILAPEGVYVIMRYARRDLVVPDDTYAQYQRLIERIQSQSLRELKIHTVPSRRVYYSRVVPVTRYATMIDTFLKTIGLRLLYYPRRCVNSKWIMTDVTLPL